MVWRGDGATASAVDDGRTGLEGVEQTRKKLRKTCNGRRSR
jgi:hypothetical protein